MFDVGRSMLDVRCWMFDVGCLMLDVRCWMFDVGCSMLDVRCWMFDVRCSMFFGTWNLELGIWNFPLLFLLLNPPHPLKKPHHRISMLQHFPFVPTLRHTQRIPLRMAQYERSARSQHPREIPIIQKLLRKRR